MNTFSKIFCVLSFWVVSNISLMTIPVLASDINGKWRGKYLCGQGVTGVTLIINQIKSDVIVKLYFYPLPENPGVPRGSALYQGSFDEDSQYMILKGVKWLEKPAPGWIIVDFSGKFDSQFIFFSGQMLNPACGNIDLIRISD